uniref:Secreted protein n=1 Tax=Heterorhabditis bacteriophora TaxID=37862 RepID=A0A1I7XC52_HETBA
MVAGGGASVVFTFFSSAKYFSILIFITIVLRNTAGGTRATSRQPSGEFNTERYSFILINSPTFVFL